MLLVVLDDLFMQMGTSSWEWMPPYVAGEVMEQLKWERGASVVFRRVCKGWRDMHDQCVRHLSVNTHWFNSAQMLMRVMMRCQRVNEIDMRGNPQCRPASVVVGSSADKWLWALAGLTARTSLNLQQFGTVSNNGLRALAGLTSLSRLNLEDRGQGLTSLSSQVSGNGLRALPGLTALTGAAVQCARLIG
jgi:hypothetical protein